MRVYHVGHQRTQAQNHGFSRSSNRTISSATNAADGKNIVETMR
jgi:hypothetical protein